MNSNIQKNRASGISIASRHIIIALAVMLILPMLISCGGGGGGGGGNPPGNDPPGNDPPGNDPPGNDPPGNDPPGNDPPGDTPVDNPPPVVIVTPPIVTPPLVVITPPPTVTISFGDNAYYAVRGGADANLVLEITDSDGNSAGAPTDYTFDLTTVGADVADYQIWDGTMQIAGGTDFTPEIAFAENDTSKTLRIVAVNTPIAPLNLQFPNSTDSQYLHSSERTNIYLLASAVSIVTFSTGSITATEGDDVTVTLNLNPAQTSSTDIRIHSDADTTNDIELLNATTLAELPADDVRKIVTVPAGDTSVNFIIRFVAGGTSEPTEMYDLTIPDAFRPPGIIEGTMNEIDLTIIDDRTVVPTCVMGDTLSYNGIRSCSYGTDILSVDMNGYILIGTAIRSEGISRSIYAPNTGDTLRWESSDNTVGVNQARIWTLDNIIS